MMNRLMKKVAVAIAAAAMTIAATASIASADETRYVSYDSGVNVRQSPDVNSERISGLYKGDAVDVVEDLENGWTMINLYGRAAYVISDSLSYSRPSQSDNYGNVDEYGFKADCNERTHEFYEVSVAPGTYLTLRSAASSDPSTEIGQLHTGDIVIATPGYGQFWYVRSDIGCGYVNSNYLV